MAAEAGERGIYDVLDGEGAGARLQVEVQHRANYALALAGIGVVRAIRLWAPLDRPLPGADIVLTLAPLTGEPTTVTLHAAGEIPPGGLVRFDDPEPLRALAAPLARATEATHGVLSVTVRAPEPIIALQASCDIDAFNEFRVERRTLAALAPFVQPNATALTPLLKAASDLLGDKTGSNALDGYQQGPARARQIAGALYEAIRAASLTYINPPASFESSGQKVRTTEQVLGQRMGTCIDLSVMYAAALEASGLHPLIFLTRGHAFAGWYSDETYGEMPVVTDPNVIANIVETSLAVPVELTGVGTRGRAAAFKTVTELALGQVRGGIGDLRGMVDIVRARLDGVLPMPATTGTLNDEALPAARPFVARSSLANLSAPPAQVTRHALRVRRDDAPPRVRAWKRELLDLSLRNPLLNLPRNRRVVDLLVPGGLLPKVDDWLHAGRTIKLTPADEVGDLADARGVQSAAELNAETIERQFDLAHSLYTVASGAWANGSLRAMRRDAKLLEQETGSNYLYLAIGALVHAKPSGAEARAPILLLPVRISGGIAGRPYSIKADGEDEAIANLCLVQWLAVTRGIALPELTEPPADGAALSLPELFTTLRQRMLDAGLPLRIEESAALAVLRFSTFQIWRDLDANWGHFLDNPVVEHLVNRPGETFEDPADGSPVPLDESALRLPIAADGSQLRAIARGAAGRSFVLEGPPGTGKSQTIANLIAHSLCQGKKVLFVAEKQAALEVVSRRLRQVGIAPYCLDLHGQQQTMAAIREQLREALAAAPHPAPIEWQVTDSGRDSAITALNQYPATVHGPNAAGLSLWSAYDALRSLGRGPATRLQPSLVAGPPDGSAMSLPLREASSTASKLQEIAIQLGLRSRHPWLVAAAGATSAAEPDQLTAALDRLAATRPLLAQLTASGLALLRGFPPLGALAGALDVAGSRGTSSQPQPGDGAYVARPSWADAVTALERDVAALPAEHPVLSVLAPGALLSPDLPGFLARAQAADASWWLRGRNRRRLAADMTPLMTQQVAPDQLTSFLLEWHQAAQRADHVAAQAHAIAGLRLPSDWRPEQPDAVARLRASARLARLGARLETAGTLTDVLELTAGDEALWREIHTAWSSWLTAIGGTDRSVAWWRAGTDWIETWAESEPAWRQGVAASGSLHAQRFAALGPLVAQLDAAGLAAFADEVMSGHCPPPDIALALTRSLAAASLEERADAAGLARFDSAALDREVAQFLAASRATREQAVTRVPAEIAAHRPFDSEHLRGEVAELARQIERKRGGKSFRELVRDYPNALTALTPCFLMSPGSVAHFLDASSITFDIAIFDEASQIRVPQAIGAMGRARSVIVVGDSKQMPPTRVMEVDASRYDEEVRAAAGASDVVVADLESILSETVESGLPREWLAWHYRSRDESLISFSNERYYSSRLVTLPGPQIQTPSAVSWRRVDGAFDRGRSRTNLIEAQAIVDEVAARLAAPSTRTKSIGIVTFNIQQRDLILTLLEDSPDLNITAALEAPDGADLFVKNLENVQGDERDTILFSLAFSPDPVTGVLPLNFGPLNLEGGERRLNVAVTRARESVVLFSSFDPAHIDLARTSSKGLADLRDYLQFAADGPQLTAHAAQARDRLGDEVAAALRERGFEVARGVGLSAFAVDVAVRSPAAPEWELAIMLDSPSWNSRPTVADRDGAPELLHELMGWPRVRRVWLPGWLRAREECIERLMAALAGPPDAGKQPARPTPGAGAATLETAMVPSGASCAGSPGEPSPAVAEPTAVNALSTGREPPSPDEPRPAPLTGPFTPAPRAQRFEQSVLNSSRSLPQYAVAIARDALGVEGPMPLDRLAGVIGRVCGFARIGPTKRAEIEAALAGTFRLTGFGGTVVWPPNLEPDSWRGVRRTANGDRTFDEVPLHEVANAVERVVRESMSVTQDQLERETLDVLGFIRVTDSIRPRLEAAIGHAISTGRIMGRGDRYYPA